MSQFGPEIDKKLNKASRDIGEAEQFIAEGTKLFNDTWEEVYSLFDEFGKERFLADDGNYLYRQTRGGSPVLREDDLRSKLTPEQLAAVEIVTEIPAQTVRKIDPGLLEIAKQKGLISADTISSCITPGKPTYPRMRNKWTKDDQKIAERDGIKVQE